MSLPCALFADMCLHKFHAVTFPVTYAISFVGPGPSLGSIINSYFESFFPFSQSFTSERKNVNDLLSSCRRLDKQHPPLLASKLIIDALVNFAKITGLDLSKIPLLPHSFHCHRTHPYHGMMGTLQGRHYCEYCPDTGLLNQCDPQSRALLPVFGSILHRSTTAEPLLAHSATFHM